MAIRILWDKYETALLIDTYLRIASGGVDRKTGISELSKDLRKRAINAGKEIDNIYRNENGIAMQLVKIESLMLKKPDAQKHNTKIFIDMVDLYTTDQDQFNRILDDAKGVKPMKSRQDKFFEWLSKEVPSFRMSDYFFAIGELEGFARKKRIFSGSLFDIVDPAISSKIVTAVSSDKIFRFTHKKQMKNITDLAQYFHNYTKNQAQMVSRQNISTETKPVSQQKPETTAQAESDPVIEKLFSALNSTFDSKPIIEEKRSPEKIKSLTEEDSDEKYSAGMKRKVVEISGQDGEIDIIRPEMLHTVDFANENDYAFTHPISISYFGEISHESSWRKVYVKVCQLLLEDYPDEFEYLRDNNGGGTIVYRLIHTENGSLHLHTPVKIGDNYYIETNRSASDLMRYIKYLLDYCGVDYENLVITYEKSDERKEHGGSISEPVQVSIIEGRDAIASKDTVIVYLEQCGLKYHDYRHKGGCLWIIGSQNITDKMKILQKNGVRVYFKAGGGNATEGKDAWWTKDTATKPIEWLDKRNKGTAQPFREEKTFQSCSVLEGRSAFQAWMETNNISKSSARTAAWALTKVSEIAIEQGITTDPLYTICDAQEAANVVARLECNRVFQEYRHHNTVALFAARKYAAFRMEQRDGSIAPPSTSQLAGYSQGDGVQSASLKQRSVHLGRLEFEQWLKENNCPSGSIRTYADGVERIGKFLLDNGLEDRNIFAIRGMKRIEKIRAHRLVDKV